MTDLLLRIQRKGNTMMHPSEAPGPLDQREFIAALVMAGMMTAGVPRGESKDAVLADCADTAVSAADALIERLAALRAERAATARAKAE